MFRTPATTRFALTALATVSLLVTRASVVSAHPGHGSPSAQTGLQHYVTSPLHAGPVLMVAAIVAVGVWLAVRFQQSKSDD